MYFLTGTDEHGINIQRAAEKNSRTPQEQVDHISDELKRMFRDFGLDPGNRGYDIFMPTTEPFHYEGVQHLWREIAKNKLSMSEKSEAISRIATTTDISRLAESDFIIEAVTEDFSAKAKLFQSLDAIYRCDDFVI